MTAENDLMYNETSMMNDLLYEFSQWLGVTLKRPLITLSDIIIKKLQSHSYELLYQSMFYIRRGQKIIDL